MVPGAYQSSWLSCLLGRMAPPQSTEILIWSPARAHQTGSSDLMCLNTNIVHTSGNDNTPHLACNFTLKQQIKRDWTKPPLSLSDSEIAILGWVTKCTNQNEQHTNRMLSPDDLRVRSSMSRWAESRSCCICWSWKLSCWISSCCFAITASCTKYQNPCLTRNHYPTKILFQGITLLEIYMTFQVSSERDL